MTEPTREQIEAVLAVFEDHYWNSVMKDKDIIIQHIEATLPAALTAAAQVGDDRKARMEHCFGAFAKPPAAQVGEGSVIGVNDCQDRIANHGNMVFAATIERCAQVADTWREWSENEGLTVLRPHEQIAAAIRALKE